MTITILTGLPGSGKSETLITRANEARQTGRAVLTFACSDSPILLARPNITKRRKIACRTGLTTAVDHFLSTARCITLVGEAPPGTLLAFDEAQHFGEQVVESWCAAADRGVEILIASPSPAQIESLSLHGYEPTEMSLKCQVCQQREATTFFCKLHEDRTESVCTPCHDRSKELAERQVVDRLRRGTPYPGQEWIYQPVGLAECADWKVVREDTQARFDLIREVCNSNGLPKSHSTYLDIGCNTGFFCHGMSQMGFKSKGVDVTVNDVEVARLLGCYVRRDYVNYAVADAHEYLAETLNESVDVSSAFSVFQWVMIQKTPSHGLDCMRWLFRKTRRICILEMGESTEAHYIKRIGMKYDSAKIYEFMRSEGGFERIDVIDSQSHPIMRDLFIGYKPE